MGIQMWRLGNIIKYLSLTAAIIMKTLKHYKKKEPGEGIPGVAHLNHVTPAHGNTFRKLYNFLE